MTDLERLSRKITATLLVGQSLFTAATMMAFTVASIIAVELAGGDSRWTGVPSGLVVAGAAFMAYPIGWLMDRVGRRIGLSVGHMLGVVGSLTAGLAVIYQSLPLFLVGVFGYGLTRGVLEQGRYAAAEASPARKRAQAISWVVLGGTAGSILGPGLIELASKMADRAGLPSLSGPWFMAALFFGLSLLVVNLFLRPDPQMIGRRLAELEPETTKNLRMGGRAYKEIIRDPRVQLATGSLIFGQMAMVLVMVVTPVHMHSHHHAISSISLVIMAHTLGMFGLSFVTGWLTDKVGRPRTILLGGLTLSLSCFMGPFSEGVLWLAIALFLLGLGWNFCFVAGSTLLSEMLRPEERGRVQGITDTITHIVSGGGNLISGFIFATLGYAAMSWLTILIGLIPVALVIFSRTARRRLAVEGVIS
jgi:MFS family permease